MGQIVLVRHGQASFGGDDYDVLSDLGRRQAEATGRFLAGLEPQRVVCGGLRRQRDSAAALLAAAGSPTTVEVDDRWDEIDHVGVLAAAGDPPHAGPAEPRAFQAHFEQAVARWRSGEHDADYAEPWPVFTARVAAAFEAVDEADTTVVVTSGGPIAATAARLVGAEATAYPLLARVVVNCSLTKVVRGRSGTHLVSFNEHGHLPPEWVSYR